MTRRFSYLTLQTVLACMMARSPALAQATGCKTNNCAAGTPTGPVLPAECKTRVGGQNIAAPRIFEVRMGATVEGSSLRFNPGNRDSVGTKRPIRLEGKNTAAGDWDYQCVEWHKIDSTVVPWHSATENDSLNTCLTATGCTAANTYPTPCSFETGNINNTGTPNLTWGTCHYRDIAPATYSLECRLHGGAGGMNGDLTVVAPINLAVTNGVSPGTVNLDWTGGSLSGPWDVWKEGPPSLAPQKMQSPTRISAATGDTSRTRTDATCSSITAGQLCTFMVRECNRDLVTGNCI